MIGILTYHDGFNYGAYLQVYALQNTLKNHGIDNIIINYKSKNHYFKEYLCFLKTKNPLLLVSNIVKIIKFLSAHKKLDLTDFCFELPKLKNKNFDAVIFGSDEIWNYTNPIIGKDLSFFGKDVPTEKFVSYAASCGNMDSNINIDVDVKGLMSSFNKISVRDENSRRIVSKATGKEVELVLDPTLIYDFSSLEKKCDEKNFILFYGAGLTKKEQNEIKIYAKGKGKKLISFGYRNPFCDESAIAKGPFEFLGYIKAADEVITTMFHGTLFCIKYQKRFSIYTDEYRTNKLSTVLNLLGLENRRVGTLSLSEIQAQSIDYDTINEIIEEKKKHSIDFLLNSITD
jgi:hypothetical protein